MLSSKVSNHFFMQLAGITLILTPMSCTSTASVPVRAPNAPRAHVGVRVDGSGIMTALSILEQIAATPGQSEHVEASGSAESWRASDVSSVRPGEGENISTTLSRSPVENATTSSAEYERNSIHDLAGGGGSSGSAFESSMGSGSSPAASVGFAREIDEGARLIDIIGDGVIVDGRRVWLAAITPLSDFATETRGHSSSASPTPLFETGPVRAQIEVRPVHGEEGAVDLVVGLRGSTQGAPRRQRRRVHLVLDRSESMEPIWHEVIAAARGLVEHLSPHDYLQIVAYGSSATSVLPPTVVGDGSAAIEALRDLPVGGYTNIEAGLELAYDAVEAAREEAHGDSVVVILVSDGVPNVGAFGSVEVGAITAHARTALRCMTASVGLGLGFDAAVLQAVAREGRGGYYVAQNAAELLPNLVAEIAGQEHIAGRDVDVEIALQPGVSVVEMGPELTLDHRQRTVSFGLPTLGVTQERSLTVRLNIGPSTSLATVRATFNDGNGGYHHAEQYLSTNEADTGIALGPPSAIIDAELAEAIDGASRAVRNNDGSAAEHILSQHCVSLRSRYSVELPPPVHHRLQQVEHLAHALGQLVTGAPDEDRFALERAMGSLSLRLAR